MRLGFHISIAGGLDKCIQRAVIRRCTTLQIFTGAPVQWARRRFTDSECATFAQELADLDIQPHFVHASYLLNISSPDRELREKSVRVLGEELLAAHRLQAAGVILHLGSVGAGASIDEGIARVAAAIDAACEAVPDGPALILENSAGQGNLVGAEFAELARIVATTRYPERVLCCLDTAHAFAAGIALNTEEGLESAISRIDASFGLSRLALLHLNDSRMPFASGCDRHWHIGRGEIGRDAMSRIVNHPKLVHLPFIMETPGTEADDVTNMRRVRRLIAPENRPKLPPLPKE